MVVTVQVTLSILTTNFNRWEKAIRGLGRASTEIYFQEQIILISWKGLDPEYSWGIYLNKISNHKVGAVNQVEIKRI